MNKDELLRAVREVGEKRPGDEAWLALRDRLWAEGKEEPDAGRGTAIPIRREIGTTVAHVVTVHPEALATLDLAPLRATWEEQFPPAPGEAYTYRLVADSGCPRDSAYLQREDEWLARRGLGEGA
jgi:hypothetical protein